MHVGFVSLDYPSHGGGGGVGTQVRTLAKALVQAGHRVTVVALAAPGQPSIRVDEGIKVYRVERGNVHWYATKVPMIGAMLSLTIRELEYSWAAYRQLRAIHQQDPIDVIECTETGAVVIAFKLNKIPLVVRLHGEKYTIYKHTPDVPLTLELQLSRIIQRVALRRARLMISPSQAHANEIVAELGVDHPPVTIIPNTVKVSSRNFLESSLYVDLPEAGFLTVLYAGRLERGKGILVLLAAASKVVQEIPNVRFVLAGADHPTITKAELTRLIQKYALEEHLQLLGHVPREHLPSLYRHATLCVVPSYYETFGLSALEAMSFGVPVIATTAGGLPEVVEDGVTGILVPPGDEQALAASIMRLLRESGSRQQMGTYGQERARTFFDIDEKVADNLAAYYEATGVEKVANQFVYLGKRVHVPPRVKD
jgi:glycogen(starch) synthase